jgi:hypothetical protein
MQLLTNALRSFTAYNRVSHRLFSCASASISNRPMLRLYSYLEVKLRL